MTEKLSPEMMDALFPRADDPNRPPPNPVKLMRPDARPIEFERMTKIECPVCNPASGGACMGVLHDQSLTTTMLACAHCGYEESRKKGSV
jgi:hypothetical protein